MIRISADEFLTRARQTPVADVRSPAEFEAGHIPGAVSIPLFSNEERAEIGTLYKRTGREAAIERGLELVGPKMAGFVKQAKRIAPDRQLLVHCWRGGMRSENMAWLFELSGFRVDVLHGGYKAYRRFIRERLGSFEKLLVLGGKTGSGKTEVLESIGKLGPQIIDLEKLACHKGSAFGDLGQDKQPTTEQFENDLFQAVDGFDPGETTFLEDESRGIGKVSLPDYFYANIRASRVVFIDVPKDVRIRRLVKEYAGFSEEKLAAAITRIQKKLGGLNCKLALEALQEKNYAVVTDILLTYYDKAYLKGLSMRERDKVYHLEIPEDKPDQVASAVLDLCREKLDC